MKILLFVLLLVVFVASLFANSNAESIALVYYPHWELSEIVARIGLLASFASVLSGVSIVSIASFLVLKDDKLRPHFLQVFREFPLPLAALSLPTPSIKVEEADLHRNTTQTALREMASKAIHLELEKLGVNSEEIDDQRVLETISASVDKKLDDLLKNGDLEGATTSFRNTMATKAIKDQFASIKSNLVDYRESNRKQYSLNLRMGLLLGLASVIIALYLVIFGRGEDFVTQDGAFSAAKLISFYVPWITIILIIQFLASFFLRLYRENVVTERYLRDEITTVGFKVSGVETALLLDNPAFMKTVVEQLLKTDRHTILSKDQRSVEVEKTRMEHQNHIDSLSFLAKLSPAQLLDSVKKAKN